MSRERVQAYKRTFRTYLALGVTLEQIRECVTALGDTNPGELADALDQYVPGQAFLDDCRTSRALAA